MGNRKIQNSFAALVIALAIGCLFFQDKIEDYLQQRSFDNDQRPVIANIDPRGKGVSYRAPESLSYHRTRPDMGLHARDTISTDQSSTAIISFKTGLKVELEANSLIIIEDMTASGGTLELTFLRGNVKILNQASGVKLIGTSLRKETIGKQGRAAAPIQITTSQALNLPTPTPPPVISAATPIPVAPPKINLEEKRERAKVVPKEKVIPKETLPDSYIAGVIKNQRTFLNRCYAQHLRLNPDAHGRIDTSLTIEPDGSISTARVIGSTIADPILQECVVATLQRAHFKSFHGDPIIVNYPINFE